MKKIIAGITLGVLILLTGCQQQPTQAEIDPQKAEKVAKAREVLPACSEAPGIKQETIPEPPPPFTGQAGEEVPWISALSKGFCIDSDGSVYSALVGQEQCMHVDDLRVHGLTICVDKNGKVDQGSKVDGIEVP